MPLAASSSGRSAPPSRTSRIIGPGQTESRVRQVDRARAEPFFRHAAADRQRQRLEIAGRPGREAPVIIDRQLDRLHAGCQRPCRPFRAARIESEPGSPTGFERRHHARQILGLLGKEPAAEEPRQVAGRVATQPALMAASPGAGARPGRAPRPRNPPDRAIPVRAAPAVRCAAPAAFPSRKRPAGFRGRLSRPRGTARAAAARRSPKPG